MSSKGSRFRRLQPKPDNSPAFFISGALGAESPSNVLHLSPSICIPAGLPTSSFGERAAVNLAPTSSTSTGTHVPVTSHSISISSLGSVSVPYSNSVCAQLPTHFLATAPVSTIMPVPASANAGRSVADSTRTVSPGTPGYTPALTYSQGPPTLQVCRPQTPHTANASVNPVSAPTKPASLSQQAFCRLKPKDSPLSPATKPALSVSSRPEHTASTDPRPHIYRGGMPCDRMDEREWGGQTPSAGTLPWLTCLLSSAISALLLLSSNAKVPFTSVLCPCCLPVEKVTESKRQKKASVGWLQSSWAVTQLTCS